MEMPKPTDAHRKMEMMEGSWTGEETLFPSPWDPEGGTAEAHVNNRIALDGFALIQDYEQQRGESVTFTGHGILRWDENDQCYVLHWFDCMGMPPNEFRGSFEGNVLTLVSKEPHQQSRGIWELTDETHYNYRMEISPDGENWQTFIEGWYSREG